MTHFCTSIFYNAKDLAPRVRLLLLSLRLRTENIWRKARAVRRNKLRVARVAAYDVPAESEHQSTKSQWQIFIKILSWKPLFKCPPHLPAGME